MQLFEDNRKSGTESKAGGPEYLKRFCHEYSISNNIIVMGQCYIVSKYFGISIFFAL